jgi:hypothetical protein
VCLRCVQSTCFYHATQASQPLHPALEPWVRTSSKSLFAAARYDYNVPLQIRKLSQDEAVRAFPRRGQMDLSEYVEAVRALQPGDTAAMDLGDLTTRAAKRRLGQAAAQLGRRLRWALSTDSGVVYFQVLAAATPRSQTSATAAAAAKPRLVTRAEVAPEPAASPTPAAQHKRGRPRKAR